MPRSRTADIIGKQLLRCMTSVGANYRAACSGKSSADFIHKMAIVQEEADESLYWMELLIESNLVQPKHVDALMQEGRELVAMTIASIKTTRKNMQQNK